KVALSGDGRVLARSGVGRKITLWDPATGKLLLEKPMPPEGVHGLALSPDGKRIITRTVKGTLRVLEAATGQEVLRFGPPPEAPNFPGYYAGLPDACLAVSPDGKTLVSVGWGADKVGPPRRLLFWDLGRGKPAGELELPAGAQAVCSLAFSPDG